MCNPVSHFRGELEQIFSDYNNGLKTVQECGVYVFDIIMEYSHNQLSFTRLDLILKICGLKRIENNTGFILFELVGKN